MEKPNSTNRTVCMLARLPCAHYDASIKLFSGMLADHGISMITTASPTVAIAHRGPVIIMLVEQYTLATHAVAIARALVGRRTAAMVFRAQEALTGTKLKTRLKRLLLGIERHMSPITMMSIVPLDILPKADSLFKSWLHDPQIWDVPFLPAPSVDRNLAERVVAEAHGRRVVVALGLMESYKGVEMLAALAKDKAFCSKYMLVIAGLQLEKTVPIFAEIQSDCIIENRYISDGELYALYDVADFIWSVYGPSYDQASGIFGRAIQFGRTPIIRKGSLIDQYSTYLGAKPVIVAWQAEPSEIAMELDASSGKISPLVIGNDVSRANLMTALYGDLP